MIIDLSRFNTIPAAVGQLQTYRTARTRVYRLVHEALAPLMPGIDLSPLATADTMGNVNVECRGRTVTGIDVCVRVFAHKSLQSLIEVWVGPYLLKFHASIPSGATLWGARITFNPGAVNLCQEGLSVSTNPMWPSDIESFARSVFTALKGALLNIPPSNLFENVYPDNFRVTAGTMPGSPVVITAFTSEYPTADLFEDAVLRRLTMLQSMWLDNDSTIEFSTTAARVREIMEAAGRLNLNEVEDLSTRRVMFRFCDAFPLANNLKEHATDLRRQVSDNLDGHMADNLRRVAGVCDTAAEEVLATARDACGVAYVNRT